MRIEVILSVTLLIVGFGVIGWCAVEALAERRTRREFRGVR